MILLKENEYCFINLIIINVYDNVQYIFAFWFKISYNVVFIASIQKYYIHAFNDIPN